MALSIELLKTMDGPHAINALRADFDPLVNTPLEAFLIDWIDQLDDLEPVGSAATEYDLPPPADIEQLGGALIQDVPTTVALLEVLSTAGIDTPSALTAKLERADKFYDIANEAGDVISRLNTLITETL